MITLLNLAMDGDAEALAPSVLALAPSILALLAAIVSAALYGRRRRWTELFLVAVAGLSLAVVLAAALGGLRLRTPLPGQQPLDVATGTTGQVDEATLLALPRAPALALSGDGLHAAQWRDLPARPVQWQPPAAPALWLDFPRTLALGRSFTLSVHGAAVTPGARLQLLAENGQMLADSGPAPASGGAMPLSVQWLPPLAEALVLRARLLDARGQPVAQGPVPLQVLAPAPLQVMGRFDAPSFDVRTLGDLLVAGHARLDWQVTLGKGIVRSEYAPAPLTAPNALIVDAAYVERLGAAARAALLAQAAHGVPLLILGGNASDAALWQRELGLSLERQSATTAKEDERRFTLAGAVLAMPHAALNPAGGSAAPRQAADASPAAVTEPDAERRWHVRARDDQGRPWLWQRQDRRGQISWIGVADWHRYAISAPQALASWWQQALDQVALASEQETAWHLPEPMPLPGLRSEICVRGEAAGGQLLHVDGQAPLHLQARSERADSACAALWPQQAGWLRFHSTAVAAPGMTYVFAADDWPLWQRALRRDATSVYAARAPRAAGADAPVQEQPAPVTPFAVLFALCMLGLWWREQGVRTG